VGIVAARLGRPQVVAEMIAGVLLGPSLFGWLWPEAQQALFPWDPSQRLRDTQSYLFPASQLGLALYMFIVGLEFRVDIIKRSLRTSVMASLAGIVAPFVLGAALAWSLHGRTDFGLFPSVPIRKEVRSGCCSEHLSKPIPGGASRAASSADGSHRVLIRSGGLSGRPPGGG
jgi:Kef-type K+ transport system membrane component KefB